MCLAAQELLNEKSFEHISVEEIAAKAGSSVGGFYARFPDKGAMFDYLYNRYVDGLRETIQEMFALERWRGVPLAERVQAFVHFALTVTRSKRGLIRALMIGADGRPESEKHAQTRQRNDIIDGVRDFLLECQGEMSHPDPALAIRMGFFFVVAAIHEKEVFNESTLSRHVGISDDVFTRELSLAFLAYVGASPPDLNPPTITPLYEGLPHVAHK